MVLYPIHLKLRATMGELEDGICLYGTRESMWSITLLGKSGNTDISHMGRLRVKGKDAEELLQSSFREQPQ